MSRPLATVYLGLGAYFLGAYLFIAWHTLPYPYLLDWLEGGTVDSVARALRGLPLYVEPSFEYVAFNYPPLYFQAAALVARLTGIGLLAPRLTSFLASLGVALLIWCFIRREGGSPVIAGIGVGLFLGAFEPAGQWYHLARVDSVHLLLLIAGFYLLRFAPGRLGAGVAGAALALAFFAKQTALIATLPALAILALVDWRRAAAAGVGFALLFGAGVLALNAASDGWFGYFAFTVPAAGGNDWLVAISFWTRDVGRVVLLAFLAAVALLWMLWAEDRKAAGFHAGMLAAALLCGMLGRMHMGGVRNALMPLYAVLAILMPLALHHALRSARLPISTAAARALIAHVLVVAQLAVLLHDPGDALPTTADHRANEQWIGFLRAIDGEVLVMDQRYLPSTAGKRAAGLDMPVTDVLRVNDAVAAKLKASILGALGSGRFVGVVDPLPFVRAEAKLGPPVAIPAPDVSERAYHFREVPTRYYPLLRAP